MRRLAAFAFPAGSVDVPVGIRIASVSVGGAALHTRRKIRQPVDHLLDGVVELDARVALEHIPACANRERAPRQLRIIMHREKINPTPGCSRMIAFAAFNPLRVGIEISVTISSSLSA
jgi:hypothetical protein